MLINVDDIVITRNNVAAITYLKQFLHSRFRITYLGDLKYLMGMRCLVPRWESIFLSENTPLKYLKMEAYLSTPTTFPMEQNVKLSNKGDLLIDLAKYRRLAGWLIYLTITRHDIMYAVLSQFLHEPRKLHMEAALRVLRYLNNTPGQGLSFHLKVI